MDFEAVKTFIPSIFGYGQICKMLKKKIHCSMQLKIPCVKRKAEWAIKWMSKDKTSFAKRVVALQLWVYSFGFILCNFLA